MKGPLTQTVSAKSDKEVTLKVTGKINDVDIPAQEQKIDLTKPYDPTKAGLAAGHGRQGGESEGREGEGEGGRQGVRLQVGDVQGEGEGQRHGDRSRREGVAERKTCRCWSVKMEMNAEIAGMKIEMEMELTESGSKSD